MNHKNNSLMVVLDHDEYCFLYDRPSFPDLLENLMTISADATDNMCTGMNKEQAREITRDLIGRAHQDL